MPPRPSARALLWRWRRLLLATAFAAILALGINSLGRSHEELETLYVASANLPAGHELTAGDLLARQAPSGLVPAALPASQVAGERLAIGLPEGAPVTSAHLLGPTLADHAPKGTIVVPVPLASPPDLTPVGTRVELWAGPTDDFAQEATRIAESATIMAFADGDSSIPLGSSSDLTRAYIAISPREARLVLGISARAPVLAVLAAGAAP